MALATIKIFQPSLVAFNTAQLNGRILANPDGDNWDTVGYVYDIASHESVEDAWYGSCPYAFEIHIEGLAPAGDYPMTITGLTPGTKYYVRMVQFNPDGMVQSDELTFFTDLDTPALGWQFMLKNQVDAEKIEEAIERIVGNHNDDPEAHLAVGQSLQSHKSYEIIDHLAASIIADKVGNYEITREKLNCNKFYIDLSWGSIDGFEYSGSEAVTTYAGAIYPHTNDTVNDSLLLRNPGDLVPLNWQTMDFTFQTIVKFGFSGDQLIYFGIGQVADEFVGFKVLNSTLYAVYITGGVETVSALAYFSTSVFHRFKVEWLHDDVCNFYVDDVLVYSRACSYISSTEQVYNISFYIKTTTTQNRSMYILNTNYFQDL
jgi:hypothetical protein